MTYSYYGNSRWFGRGWNGGGRNSRYGNRWGNGSGWRNSRRSWFQNSRRSWFQNSWSWNCWAKNYNNGPDAKNDYAKVTEDDGRTTVFNLLSNDTDRNGDTLEIVSFNNGQGEFGVWFDAKGIDGEICVLENGCVDFRPKEEGAFDYLREGEVFYTSFTYTITDGNGGYDTATARIKIVGKNDGPEFLNIPEDDKLYIDENTTYVETIIASDVEGEKVTYSLENSIDSKFLQIDPNTGVLSFKEAPDFETPLDETPGHPNPEFDGKYGVTIVATDESGASVKRTVWVIVRDVEEGAKNDYATVTEDDGRTTVFNLLSNDTGRSGNTLEIVSFNNGQGEFGVWFEAEGINGEICVLEDGCVDFRPKEEGAFDYLKEGEIVYTSFTYTITDGNGGYDTATARIKIVGKNDGPEFLNIPEDDKLYIDENTTYVETIIASDVEGEKVTYSLENSIDSKFLQIDPNTGVLSFKEAPDFETPLDETPGHPNPEFDGKYGVTIVATDESGASVKRTVWVIVRDVEEAPTAVNDEATSKGSAVTVDVLANDFDGEGDAINITSVQDPANGNVQIVDGQLVYTPDADFFGTETFEYTVTDEGGLSSTAQISVEVGTSNQGPPVLADEIYKLGSHTVTGKIKENIAGVQEFDLRLDDLLSENAGNENNTIFDFEHSDSAIYMKIDGDKVRIFGQIFGGQVDENSYGNGKIDSRAELFGGGVGEGFAKLATFDSNNDGWVDMTDTQFNELFIWQDANSNGIPDMGELMSLDAANITSLKVTHDASNFSMDAQGNILGKRSVAITSDGRAVEMIDAYFEVA
ncbi:MAG: Ig-like domain-containing protein [Cyanobacteria bacterium P01_F01_bin.150]